MKNLFVLLMAFALVGSASAWGLADVENPYTFSTDGDLTNLIPDIWGTWGGDADANGSVVVANGVCTFTTSSYEIAFCHDNALADLGDPVPGVDDVELQFDVVSFDCTNAIVKIEMYDETDAFPNNNDGEGAIRSDAWDPDSTITGPGHYIFTTADIGPIPVGTVAVTAVVGCSNGTMVIDNLWLGKAGTYSTTKATEPNPANGAVIGTAPKPALSWTNPDPNNLADMITSDVFILDAGTEPLPVDPNMSEDNKDQGVIQIANDITAETVNLPVWFNLQDEHYYYWAVNCTDPHGDPNTGEPVETLGDVWSFFTGDALPVVNAGPDEFAWVSKDDSLIDPEDDPESYYIQVTGTYTDDGKSTIADANFVNLGWDIANGEAGIEKVSQDWVPGPGVHTSGTVTAIFRTYGPTAAAAAEKPETAIPGYWDIQLQVTDGSGMGQDVAYVRVDADCATAVENDASDDFDTTFDVNRDCKIDIVDFATFAEQWLDQSVKYE